MHNTSSIQSESQLERLEFWFYYWTAKLRVNKPIFSASKLIHCEILCKSHFKIYECKKRIIKPVKISSKRFFKDRVSVKIQEIPTYLSFFFWNVNIIFRF